MLGNVGGRFRQTRETSEDCGCEASILIEKVIMAWPWERTPRIRKWCARQPKIVCAASQMVCAPIQNDVRSWQNGVRAISDGADVLGKMMCALMCALVCALMCAQVAGVPVAQRISNFCLRHLVALGVCDGWVDQRFLRWPSPRGRQLAGGVTVSPVGILADYFILADYLGDNLCVFSSI